MQIILIYQYKSYESQAQLKSLKIIDLPITFNT